MINPSKMQEALEKGYDSSFFNLPQTGNSLENEDGLQLHFRIMLPPDTSSIKAICFWGHGYGGHADRPVTQKLGSTLCDNGIAFAAHDFRGHGYSDGVRAFFTSHEQLVSDWKRFIHCVLQPSNPPYSIRFQHPSAQALECLADKPFFVMGQSMSGALALFAEPEMRQDSRYLGSVLIAPALVGVLPHPLVVWALNTFVVPFFPRSQMPSFSSPNVGVYNLSWRNACDQEYIRMDTWGEPNAIGWNQPIRWGTGAAFVRMLKAVQLQFADVLSPLLVLHDPFERVCPFEGPQRLMESCGSVSIHLVEIPGGLHDLLSNEFETVVSSVAQWFGEQIQLRSAARV